MWSLETICQINQFSAEGLDAREAYKAAKIKILGNIPVNPIPNAQNVVKRLKIRE